MIKIFLSAAVVILSHSLHSVNCVPCAEKEAVYSEILARAQQRQEITAASVEVTKDARDRRKYTAQHAKLIQDITLIFGNSISGSQKFEYLQRLMTELGFPENSVSRTRFNEFTSWINRQITGECRNIGKRSKISQEVSDKLLQMLSEKSTLTLKEASEELQRSGLGPLPPQTYLQNWIQNRLKESRFLKMLADPLADSRAATEDDFSCSFSVFSDDQEREKDSLQEEEIKVWGGKRKAPADAVILPARKKQRCVDEELYNNLLVKAQNRVGEPGSSKTKYTLEHSELIEDIVSTCDFLIVGEQFEVFRRLIEDLGIPQMPQSVFNARARAVRQRTGCTVISRSLLDPETVKVMKSIFETNPKISTDEAYAALRGKDGPMPSVDDVRKWLNNRKSHFRQNAKKRVLLSHLGSSNRGQDGSSAEGSHTP